MKMVRHKYTYVKSVKAIIIKDNTKPVLKNTLTWKTLSIFLSGIINMQQQLWGNIKENKNSQSHGIRQVHLYKTINNS